MVGEQPILLPFVRLTWDEAEVTTPGASFIRYNIYRREAGQSESDWVRIATITDVETISYEDYCIPPRTVCEYAVTQSESISGASIESDKPDPVTALVEFNWAYLHNVADPTEYVIFFSLDGMEEITQDVQVRAAWGRQAPTAFIGEVDYSQWRVNGLPDVIRGTVWGATRSIASLQRSEAAVYCFRPGITGERYFVNITNLARRLGVLEGTPDIGLVEVHYDEAV